MFTIYDIIIMYASFIPKLLIRQGMETIIMS